MAGTQETAINGFVPVFRRLRSAVVGLRRGGADVGENSGSDPVTKPVYAKEMEGEPK